LGAQGANLVSLLVTAIANTAANRRFTFGVRGRHGAGKHQFEGLIVFGLGLALTSGSLALLHSSTDPGQVAEVVAVVGANLNAAATQSATQSWKAWLFGSLDSGNVLTVDKPPAFLWVSGLFARIFGFSTWTVLAPQALEGVAAVALLHATVKRTSGPVAGLLAG